MPRWVNGRLNSEEVFLKNYFNFTVKYRDGTLHPSLNACILLSSFHDYLDSKAK